jgi:hypothetical protein
MRVCQIDTPSFYAKNLAMSLILRTFAHVLGEFYFELKF